VSLDWLCAGGGAQSSAKPFLYETASCRSEKEQKTRERENFGFLERSLLASSLKELLRERK